MNKVLKTLLVTALALGASNVQAHTNKTFLLPRAQGVNLPMEITTYKELIGRKSADKFGGNFQVTGFYQNSTEGSEQAKYFLINNKSTIAVNRTADAANNATITTGDFELGYIIHEFNSNAGLNSNISFDPEQTVYGVRFDYHQDLDKILKGLYLKVDLPVAHVENDVKIKVSSTGNFGAGVVGTGAVAVQTTLQNYFSGNFANSVTGGENKQVALANAKIAGEQSETGVADIDVALGYKFLKKENYGAALALAITIPTGNEADGVYLFEPLVGNGKHFGLGGDLCAHAKVWGDVDHNIKLHLKMKYRYLFENSEKRTLGIKNDPWGQYNLLAPATFPQGTSLIPAANITTLNVDVTPGSQFDGILGLAYNNGGFTFDLGYNMYFREAEEVKLKGAYTDNAYVIVARNKSTNLVGGGADSALQAADVDGAALVYLNKTNLDLSTAETPSQFTNSIYGGLGYIFKEWDNPLMLGLGGKYEWASKNSALDQWSVSGKIGIGF